MPAAERRTRNGETVYLARVFYKGKKVTVGLYSTEDEADYQISRAIDRIKGGRPPWPDADTTPTFRDYVNEEFFPSLNADLQQNTVDDYRRTLKNVLAGDFADKNVGSITHSDINKFLHEFKKNHSRNYLHKTSTRIYQVMGKASRKYHFVNPMDDPDFEKPSMPNRSRVDITLTPKEAHRIIEAADAHKDYLWRTLLTVMLLTGVRRSELLGMTPDCWDDETMTVHIFQQWDWNKRELVPNTKTEQGKRYIPVHEDLYRMVMKWADDFRPKDPKHDLLFPPPRGDEWTSESSWTRAYNVRLKWAGIKPSRKKSSHQLRHLYAAMSLQKGVPIDVLSRRLGHKDNSFTLDRYVHILEKMDRRGVDDVTSALVPPIALDQPYQRGIF